MTNREVIKRLRALKQYADPDTQKKLDYAIQSIEMRDLVSKFLQKYNKLTAPEQNMFDGMCNIYLHEIICNYRDKEQREQLSIYYSMRRKVNEVLKGEPDHF